MQTPKALSAVSALSLTGIGVSLFQTYHFYQARLGMVGFHNFCTFDALGTAFDCQAVENSKYAEFLFGMPLSSFAAGFFTVLLVISLFARNPFWWREASRALGVLSLFGMLISGLYLVPMFFIIKKLCLMCLAVDTINVLNVLFVMSLKPEILPSEKAPVDKPKLKTLALTFAGLQLAVPVFAMALNPISFSSDDLDRAFNEVMKAKVEEVKVDASMISIGPENAKITVVKFSDFQCPACRLGAYSLHPILAQYEGKIRFVYRNFPLSSACNRKMTMDAHPMACDSARVGICSKQKGIFDKMYEEIFEHQAELSRDKLFELAAKHGIQKAELEACMNSNETREFLSRDIEDGIALNIESTPTFFVNGRRLPGSLPPQLWKRVFDAILAEQK